MGGDNTTTQKQNSTSTQSMQYDPTLMKEWQNMLGTVGGLTDAMVNGTPPQSSVAGPTGLTSQWWNQAGSAAQGPDTSGVQGGYGDVYNQLGGMQRDPNAINIPSQFSFQTPQLQFNNPYSGGIPQVSAAGGVNTDWNNYYQAPQQVSTSKASARDVTGPDPGSISMVGPLNQIVAPQLQTYQMGNIRDVQAPQTQNFTMQAAANIAPTGLASTQSWTDPGVAQQYMDPYSQQVVDTQKQKAVQDWQAANETQRAQATAAGAFGGDRQAIEEATGQRDLQLQLAQIQATGLQNAYTQGAQQFNTQQALSQQAQQFNLGQTMTAQQANQQMQQQANLQNLSSYLQTQGLTAQTGLAAGQSNQQADIAKTTQNLASQNQTQQLMAQMGMTAQQENVGNYLQGMGLNMGAQTALMQAAQAAKAQNQQADISTSSTNAQLGLTASQANAANAMNAYQYAKTTGLGAGEFTSNQQQQANMQNVADWMQATGQQYAGNLQGGLQTQQLGNQNQITGAQLGLQGATQGEQLRQSQMGLNLSGAAQQGNILNSMGGLDLNTYLAGLQGLGALQTAAQSQQGMAQQQADVATQNAWQNLMTPLQSQGFLASLMAMQPMNYTQSGTQQGTTTLTQPGPSIFSQILGGVLGAAGAASGLGFSPFGKKTAHGGLISDGGLAAAA